MADNKPEEAPQLSSEQTDAVEAARPTIEHGHNAKLVLNNPAFMKILKEMEELATAKLLSTPDHDDKGRWKAQIAVVTLKGIFSNLTTAVENGEISERKLAALLDGKSKHFGLF